MRVLLELIKADYPDIDFVESSTFSWSPEKNTIFYEPTAPQAEWSLLHELGHAVSEHKDYSYDISLLKIEVQAWKAAEDLSIKYDRKISAEHIDKCLDSYREWIYKRSTCPECTQAGIERVSGKYTCINCKSSWKVTSERFCRVYRKTLAK